MNVAQHTAIEPLTAQDAFWYAECVEHGGAGESFSAGKANEGRNDHIGTLQDAWRKAVRTARDAGISLDGIDLQHGKIPERGGALKARIKEACAKVGIIAETGESIERHWIEAGRTDTRREIASTYGIEAMVPDHFLADGPTREAVDVSALAVARSNGINGAPSAVAAAEAARLEARPAFGPPGGSESECFRRRAGGAIHYCPRHAAGADRGEPCSGDASPPAGTHSGPCVSEAPCARCESRGITAEDAPAADADAEARAFAPIVPAGSALDPRDGACEKCGTRVPELVEVDSDDYSAHDANGRRCEETARMLCRECVRGCGYLGRTPRESYPEQTIADLRKSAAIALDRALFPSLASDLREGSSAARTRLTFERQAGLTTDDSRRAALVGSRGERYSAVYAALDALDAALSREVPDDGDRLIAGLQVEPEGPRRTAAEAILAAGASPSIALTALDGAAPDELRAALDKAGNGRLTEAYAAACEAIEALRPPPTPPQGSRASALDAWAELRPLRFAIDRIVSWAQGRLDHYRSPPTHPSTRAIECELSELLAYAECIARRPSWGVRAEVPGMLAEIAHGAKLRSAETERRAAPYADGRGARVSEIAAAYTVIGDVAAGTLGALVK